MRWCGLGLVVVTLVGCGGKHAPKGAVLNGWERTQAFPEDASTTARYSAVDDARIRAPLLPLMAFGAAFDVNLAVKPNHPNWDLQQFGRMTTPDGAMWVAIDARAGSLEEYLVAPVDDVDLLMPELPLRRKSSPFEVTDSSNADVVNVQLSYENVDGEVVEVSWESDPPWRFQKKRNVSDMGRSQTVMLTAIDQAHRESAFKAAVKIGGQSGSGPKYQWTTEQAIGGLAVANFNLREADLVSWSSGPTARLIDPRANVVEPEVAPEPEAEPEEAATDEFAFEDEDEDDIEINDARTRPEEGEEAADETAINDARTRPEAEPETLDAETLDDDPLAINDEQSPPRRGGPSGAGRRADPGSALQCARADRLHHAAPDGFWHAGRAVLECVVG